MKRQAGFTMLEVTIVVTLVVFLLGMVFSATAIATRSLSTDDLVAKSMENLQRAAIRISQIARPCSLTTYRMLSTQWDVNNSYAATVGEWIEPVQNQARQGIRFQSAAGQLSMNAIVLTQPRTLRLRLDAGEIRNGVDDDGDGLVDEGEVTLDYDGSEITMATNIETCNFTLTGRTLLIELRSGARASDGKLQHFRVNEMLYLRNN